MANDVLDRIRELARRRASQGASEEELGEYSREISRLESQPPTPVSPEEPVTERPPSSSYPVGYRPIEPRLVESSQPQETAFQNWARRLIMGPMPLVQQQLSDAAAAERDARKQAWEEGIGHRLKMELATAPAIEGAKASSEFARQREIEKETREAERRKRVGEAGEQPDVTRSKLSIAGATPQEAKEILPDRPPISAGHPIYFPETGTWLMPPGQVFSKEDLAMLQAGAESRGNQLSLTYSPQGVTKGQEVKSSIADSYQRAVRGIMVLERIPVDRRTPEQHREYQMLKTELDLLKPMVPAEFGVGGPSQLLGPEGRAIPRVLEQYWDNERNAFALDATPTELRTNTTRYAPIPREYRAKVQGLVQLAYVFDRARDLIKSRPDLWPAAQKYAGNAASIAQQEYALGLRSGLLSPEWWQSTQAKLKFYLLDKFGAGIDPDVAEMAAYLATLPLQSRGFGDVGNIGEYDQRIQLEARRFQVGGSAAGALRSLDTLENLFSVGLKTINITSVFKPKVIKPPSVPHGKFTPPALE